MGFCRLTEQYPIAAWEVVDWAKDQSISFTMRKYVEETNSNYWTTRSIFQILRRKGILMVTGSTCNLRRGGQEKLYKLNQAEVTRLVDLWCDKEESDWYERRKVEREIQPEFLDDECNVIVNV